MGKAKEFENLAKRIYSDFACYAPYGKILRKRLFIKYLLFSGLYKEIEENIGINPHIIVNTLDNHGKDVPSWREFFSYLSLAGAMIGTYPAKIEM